MLTRDDIVRSYIGEFAVDKLKDASIDSEAKARRHDYIAGVVSGLARGDAYVDYAHDKVLASLPVDESEQEMYGKDVLRIYEGKPNDCSIDERGNICVDINLRQAVYMSPEEAFNCYLDRCEDAAAHGEHPEYAVPVHATPTSLQVLQGTYSFDYSAFDNLVETHMTEVGSEHEAKSMKHALENMLHKEPSNPMFYGQTVGVTPTLEALHGGHYRVSVDAEEFDSIVSDMTPQQFDEFRFSYEQYCNDLNPTVELSVATDAYMMDENMNYSGFASRKYTYGFLLDQKKSSWVDCEYGLSDNPYDVIERADLSIYTPAEQAEIATYRETGNIQAAKQVADTLNEQAKTQVRWELREMERQNRMEDNFGYVSVLDVAASVNTSDKNISVRERVNVPESSQQNGYERSWQEAHSLEDAEGQLI